MPLVILHSFLLRTRIILCPLPVSSRWYLTYSKHLSPKNKTISIWNSKQVVFDFSCHFSQRSQLAHAVSQSRSRPLSIASITVISPFIPLSLQTTPFPGIQVFTHLFASIRKPQTIMSSYEESDTNRSSGGGAKLFSPSNTDSAIKRATSILPGVKPRETPQTPHPSRRQPSSISAAMSGPPPPFNLPGASSSHSTRKSHATTHPTSTSSHDEIEGYMSPETQRVRLVSPSTAQLMRSLQKINQDAKKSSETENLHPSIVVSDSPHLGFY